MARTISASVGRMGGVNRRPDVETVQELLNRVPPGRGGPAPPLDVDGLCGPLTIRAIQEFQLHHFGWSGADGRVDPGRRTIRKLNEFDTLGIASRVIRGVLLPGAFLDPRDPTHWFFEIGDPAEPGSRAVYHLGSGFEPPPLRVPGSFLGPPVTFHSKRPVSGFATRGASYLTAYFASLTHDVPIQERLPVSHSRLDLVFLADPARPGSSGFDRRRIVYPAHIEPPLAADHDGSGPVPTRGVDRVVRTRGGSFRRVR